MKTPRWTSVLLVALVLLAPGMTMGQKLAQTGLQFLEIGVSPRAEAMGGAFVLAGDRSDALFYNPAGVAKTNTLADVSLNRVKWFADIGYDAIGVAIRPWDGEYWVMGLSFVNARYGDFYGTMVAPGTAEGYTDMGVFTPTAFAVGLTYAKQLNDQFSVGGQVKYLRQDLGSNILTAGGSSVANSLSGFAFDFGVIYLTPIDGFDFGMSIKNFAKDFKYEQYSFEAPLTFRIGASLNVFKLAGWSAEHHGLIVVGDLVHPRDFGEHYDVGAEYRLYNIVAFRVGYKIHYSELGFTGGLGLNYDVLAGVNVRVDYSYGSFGIWDAVHRFSLGFSL